MRQQVKQPVDGDLWGDTQHDSAIAPAEPYGTNGPSRPHFPKGTTQWAPRGANFDKLPGFLRAEGIDLGMGQWLGAPICAFPEDYRLARIRWDRSFESQRRRCGR
ncbi:hypothetical protein GCM10022227_47260 [Streptomyces sedi]